MKKLGGSGFKVRVATALVTYIWIHNVAFIIPLFQATNVHTSESGGSRCYPVVDNAYVVTTRIVNFYVPLVVMWIAYIGIIFRLRRSINKAVRPHFNFRSNIV